MNQLDVMAQIAQPLDQWCVFNCGRLGTLLSADGVYACEECAKQVVQAEAKYAADARFLAEQSARPKGASAKQSKARAKRRAKRKRTKR